MPITTTRTHDECMQKQKQKSGHRGVYLVAVLAVASNITGPLGANAANSQDATPPSVSNGTPEGVAFHGQATLVEQGNFAFHAPYRAANSFDSGNVAKETLDATAFIGARLWVGSEIWINPEIDQGFGLSDTLGIAGFPSGEAYKVGKKTPYLRLQRLFLRQTFNLDKNVEPVDGGLNQLAGYRSADRIVLTVGKFSVPDLFDTNQYAHDTRADFLNWAALDAGSFDYAADAWGYTVGAAAEWYQGAWTVRGGVFDLSDVPNSEKLDSRFHQFQADLELEKRYEVVGKGGRVLFTVFQTRGRMGRFVDAIHLAQMTGVAADIVAVRQYRNRTGISFNLEQQLSADLGVFARTGVADGNVEPYEFTDIDRTLSMGLSAKGTHWGRTQDKIGLVGIVNAISAAHQDFFNVGGLGILIGDGRLPHPRPEEIVETYYDMHAAAGIDVSLDYQFVDHPAYNPDRGPVSILGLRIHGQF